MVTWLESREEFELYTKSLKQYGDYERIIRQKDSFFGFCNVCNRFRELLPSRADSDPKKWTNLLEGALCVCEFNGRSRLILSILDDLVKKRFYRRSSV
mgnify:CR=1 FL=1